MATVDNFFVLMATLVISITALAGIFTFNAVTADDINTDLWAKTSEGVAARENVRTVYDNIDTTVIIIWLALHLGVLVLVFSLRTHPVVLVGAILLMIILPIVAAPIANVWETLITTSDFLSAATQMTKTSFIMSKLPLFEVIWSVLTAVVLVGTARDEGI